MSEVITHELLKSWSPCEDGYKRFCDLFPNGADLATAIDGLVNDGHDEWGHWLFCKCRDNGLFKELTDKGYRNSGYRNSGNWNSGNRNSGNQNSGNLNSGNRNSGDWNSGDWNSGNLNSGNRNSGNQNSGDWNSGNLNSGDWNSGDWNSGYFNNDRPSIVRVFGKDCSFELWDKAYKPTFLYFDLTYWVDESDMTDEEKKTDPGFFVRGGQLRKRDYKEAFRLSWDNADKQDRIRVKDLPNFDATMFLELSGIDVNA